MHLPLKGTKLATDHVTRVLVFVFVLPVLGLQINVTVGTFEIALKHTSKSIQDQLVLLVQHRQGGGGRRRSLTAEGPSPR